MRRFGTCVLLLLAATLTHAQSEFSSRPLRIVVPFAAGGPTDTIARIISPPLAERLGVAVNVDNLLGSGGMAGVAAVAASPPDGHTILLYHIGMATAPALYRGLPFDPVRDFAPIGLLNEVPMTLITRPSFPAETFAQFLGYARAQRDKLRYAHAGIGSASHLCGILLMRAMGIELRAIAYKGTAPAMSDLIAGGVDIMCDQTTHTTAPIRARRVKVYGVTTRSRIPSLPDVATLDEQGLPGFEIAVWHALYAPRRTPPATIAKLVRALQLVLQDPRVKSRFSDVGAVPAAPAMVTPDALAAHLKFEIEKWHAALQGAAVPYTGR